MIPVMQTKYGYPEGNCLVACVASILEKDIDDFPNLHEECERWDEEKQALIHIKSWWNVLQNSVNSYGWDMVYVMTPENYPQGYAIACGDSPRETTVREDGSNAGHAVVYKDGEMVHDPHPDNTGLKTIEGWIVLLPPMKNKEE